MSLRNFCSLSTAFLLALGSFGSSAQVQHRECGQAEILARMAKENPAQYQEYQEKYKALVIAAQQGPATNAKTAAQYPIPVMFHFLVTQSQYNYLGQDTGIRRRVISQLQALNADYNRGNADSTRIPAPFKSLYANIGIRFGLAGTTTADTKYPGIEIKIVPSSPAPAYDYTNSCYLAKVAGATGLAALDPGKYLNVWVLKMTSTSILGVTTPPSFVGYTSGGHTYASGDVGVVLNYQAFGKREFPAQNFSGPFSLGRTMTHEIGHFFELRHIWGDDDEDNVVRCPADAGGADDYITDTPPQGKRNYCDLGTLSNTCPVFPLTDKCQPASPGIMFMNYMDYTDDSVMEMFSKGQASVMNSFLASESISLTQNPGLLAVNDVLATPGNVSIAPNPASGAIRLSLERAEGFQGTDVINMMGQTVARFPAKAGVKQYDFDLSWAPRGIYIVYCRYDAGTITQKLILE